METRTLSLPIRQRTNSRSSNHSVRETFRQFSEHIIEEPISPRFLQSPEEAKTRLKACGLWLFGCTCWVVGYLYPNQHNIAPQITNIWRACFVVILNYFILQFKHYNTDIVDQYQYWWCLIRILIICFNAFVFTLSQFYMPLPIVHTINCTAPVFALLFDRLFYQIKLPRKKQLGVLAAFVGILLIAIFSKQPSYVEEDTRFQHYIGLSEAARIGLIALLMFNSMAFGFGCVIIKKMNKIHPSGILFYTGIALAIFAGILFPYRLTPHLASPQANDKVLPGEDQISLKVYIGGYFFSGLVFSLGQITQMWALKICVEAGRILIMQNFTVLVAYFLSIIVYGEPIYPICLLGAIITIAGVIQTVK